MFNAMVLHRYTKRRAQYDIPFLSVVHAVHLTAVGDPELYNYTSKLLSADPDPAVCYSKCRKAIELTDNIGRIMIACSKNDKTFLTPETRELIKYYTDLYGFDVFRGIVNRYRYALINPYAKPLEVAKATLFWLSLILTDCAFMLHTSGSVMCFCAATMNSCKVFSIMFDGQAFYGLT